MSIGRLSLWLRCTIFKLVMTQTTLDINIAIPAHRVTDCSRVGILRLLTYIHDTRSKLQVRVSLKGCLITYPLDIPRPPRSLLNQNLYDPSKIAVRDIRPLGKMESTVGEIFFREVVK